MRISKLVMVCAILLLFSACGNPSKETGKDALLDSGDGAEVTDMLEADNKVEGTDVIEDGKEEQIQEIVISNADIADEIAKELGKQGNRFSEDELLNIRKLEINEIQSGDISELKYLINLEYLWIYKGQITDFSVLSQLQGLKYLYLDNTGLGSLDIISELSSLKVLSVRDNHISSLSGIEKLTKLQELYVSGNEIGNWDEYNNYIIRLDICDREVTEPETQKIEFMDEKLESEIRKTIGVYDEDFNRNQLNDVVLLVITEPEVCAIDDLVMCENLYSLVLWDTEVKNVLPILEMPGLREFIMETKYEIDTTVLTAHPGLNYVQVNGEVLVSK